MNGGTDVAVGNAVEKGTENVNGDTSRTFCPPDLLPVNIAENDVKNFHSQPESKNDEKIFETRKNPSRAAKSRGFMPSTDAGDVLRAGMIGDNFEVSNSHALDDPDHRVH